VLALMDMSGRFAHANATDIWISGVALGFANEF
jgi:hypothetical protein